MARLESQMRRIKWASVEFQPHLHKPTKPVKLGAVLVEDEGDFIRILVIGRVPIPDDLPAEFVNCSELTVKLASAWVKSMFDEACKQEVDKLEEIFEYLAARWRWNLYLTTPKRLKTEEVHGSLDKIAERVYERVTGEPFRAGTKKPKSHGKSKVDTPSRWKYNEVDYRSNAAMGAALGCI